MEKLFTWTESLLSGLEPRILDCKGVTTTLLIFTHAAYENEAATWGCVVIDPSTGVAEVSGGSVPDPLVSCWLKLAGKQVITQAEAFAALLARRAYETLIKQRRVILFVDNEAARYALIHGSSPSVSLLKLVQSFHSCSVADSSIMWLDLPSRGRSYDAAELINGKVVNIDHVVESLALEVSFFDDSAFDFLLSCVGEAEESTGELSFNHPDFASGGGVGSTFVALKPQSTLTPQCHKHVWHILVPLQ